FGGPISINSSLWDLMREGTNYVSLSVYDKAGNSYQIDDAFYIRKDTTAATIIDNQNGDDIWHSSDPGAVYDADFSDYSSSISSASYIVYSQTGQSGDLIKSETQIFNYPFGSYLHTANWGLDFASLREGLNYVSVKAYDRAGNVSVLNDIFYVKKDTSAPIIYDSQSGDDIWRNINIATYAVSFADYGIGISTLAISAYTLPSSAGQQLINYATFYFGSPIPSYSSGWGLTNQMWDLLKQGTNYIKIHAVDGLGNETQVQDVFYVRKDTTSPSALTLSAFTPSFALDEGKILLTWSASGDDALIGAASYYMIRYSPSEILEGDFSSASIFISTLTPKNSGQSESVFIDGLTASVTYYFAVKVVDKAGNISLISNSPFSYAGLDKTPPSAISDLSASQGDFTGQIKLDWTAVGEGTAGLEGNSAAYSYLVKYTSSVWSGFDAVNVSTYTQTWVPLAKGSAESRVIEGLLPGTTYTIAIKVIDEAGNISPVSNVVIATAAPAGAADGLIIYPQSGASDLKYRTWSPIIWGSQLNTSLNSAASARWIIIKAVPTFANAKIAGVLYSDNSLRFYKYDGLSGLWSDITPTPAPIPAASNYRKFDMAVENNSGRIMVAYYNNSGGSISYAIYSATASAWVVGPSSLSLASLTGTVNWVKLKSLPGSDKIALAVLDSNSDISAAIWDGIVWGNNVNLTAAASLATKEVFDISWETLSGDLMAMWGTGTTTNYRKYYSTSTWSASALTGPNPAAAVQWLRLSSDPLSNRIGASYLYGTTSWNAAIWRAAGTENWTPSTADTTVSQVAARITDCAWQSKTSKFIAVAADEIGSIDNKFKTAVWSGGAWSATPAAGTLNNYTVFAGSINWLSLYPDPNTDNITLLGIDTAFDLRSTVWSGSTWADLSSSANFMHQNNLSDFNYESASADFDRHDTIPPTAIDNQSGDDVWRNSNSAYYNINATDSGGSKLAGIQTKIRTASSGGGTLIEDWTYQVSAINSDSYSLSWPFIDDTFNKIPQGQSYVWVRAVDGVGNISNEISDAFYVRKDTTPPQIINNMPSDYFSSWTSTGTGPVNIDFSDSGGSQISSAAWSAYSQSSMGGSLIVQNVLIASGTMGNSYNTGWSPDFSLMAPGTNYISVTVWDNAGSSQTLIDAFKILKDTIAPSAASDFSAQPGPLSGSILITWTAPGDDGNYNNNFQGGYIIKYATYPIVTQSLFDSASSYLSSPIPASAGAQQSAVIYELENETTYYFALRTYDKAYNISSLSPSVSSLPGRNGIFINEIYAAGNSSSDWIEFFNNTNSPISLDGWKIIYKQGALDSAAAEVQIWAGGTSDIVSSSSIYKINPNYDLNSAQSYSLILKNQQNYVIDKVQWPSMGIGESFARVYDGYEFFEIDPTPTPGYKNSISTSDIKINEISYSGYEFIEIYNLGNSTLTLTDYYLRNSNEAPFRFDRKIYPGSYSGIDDTSFSKDNFDYYSSFGLNGLKENGDFLVLEDASGQTLDRLVWQSAANYSFYDYKAVKVSAKNYAAANSLALARLNGEGYDSDLDSYDFSVPASATPFSRNSGAGQSSANTLIFPQDNSVLPANFPIKLSFGEDYSAGANDIIVFIRTSGAQDYQSPHIFRLSDIGFNLSSLSPQTSAYLSSYFSDIDGNKLSDKAYYKVILVSDKNSYSSPQIVKQNIYADFASHPYLSFKSSAAYLNENSKQAVFSFVLRNSASSYDLTLSSAIFYLYDKNSVPLTQTQAENLIKSAAIYSDSSLGEKGKYESEIDSDLAAEKQNYELSVDASGKVIIEISSSAAVSSLSLGSSSTYYLVFNSTDNASIQNPKEILVKLSQILIRDKNNFLFQPLSGFSPLISSTFTFIRPASPPAGTNWPYSAPSPLLVETMADIYNGGLLTNRVYVSGKDGIIRTVDYNGNEKWTFADSPSAEIKTAPLIREEGSFVYLYFADSLGNIYKLKDNGASGSQEWKINLSNAVSGNLIDTQDKIYTATSDGKIHCINKIDGNTCSGWTYDLGFNGSISGTLSIDDRPEINTGWIGLENGKVIAFRLSDGLILNQFTTGGPVYASPFVDSAYAYANNNLYIASADGKLYSRNSANLTAFPPYWNDFNAGSPIYSSPFKGIGEDYVYIGDDSGKLYKVSSTSGTLTGGWVYQAPEKIRTIPVALPAPHNKVFFSSGEFLYCLNTADASLCSGYPIHTGGEIKGDIIIDFDNSVLVFSSSGGKTYMIEI
ncbi:MAG: PQQ-binding-like beta-propeller repeat protein, partial [Elusimicrobia bacterium]|nr:PQQ-binding-like beta-propeller repeat protein [Elusimicrobiota bacterium]